MGTPLTVNGYLGGSRHLRESKIAILDSEGHGPVRIRSPWRLTKRDSLSVWIFRSQCQQPDRPQAHRRHYVSI
jgi:hypothetical protein